MRTTEHISIALCTTLSSAVAGFAGYALFGLDWKVWAFGLLVGLLHWPAWGLWGD